MKRKINPKGYDIIVFDCDSTLSALEGIDLLAEKHGVKKQVEEITHHAMNGHTFYAHALEMRLNLIKPNKSDLVWLGKKYIEKINKGTKELIASLVKKGKGVYIISGGFEDALRIFAKHINIPIQNIFSNKLQFDSKGRYLSFDKKNPLSRNHGKKIILKEIAQKGLTMFVGDGVTDLEAKDVVDLFVGFGGIKVRDIVKKEADIFIDDPTLAVVDSIALGKQIIDNCGIMTFDVGNRKN